MWTDGAQHTRIANLVTSHVILGYIEGELWMTDHQE